DAQSIPATLPVIDPPFPRSVDTRPCPDHEVPLRVLIDKASTAGATSCRRSRHLTTVGTGWSFIGPPRKGKRSRPSPGGGRGNPRLTYQTIVRQDDRRPSN